jgi:hypothetical protein
LDPVLAILSRTTVARVPKTDIVVLTYTGQDAADGEAILAAIIESYRTRVREIYEVNPAERLEKLELVRQSLEKDLDQDNRRYRELLREAELADVPLGSAAIRDAMLKAASEKRTALLLRRTEVQATLELAERWTEAKQPDARLLVRANEWAVRVGYDRFPKKVQEAVSPVEAYVGSLRGELEELRQQERAVAAVMREETKVANRREVIVFDLEGLRLRIAQDHKRLDEVRKSRDEVTDVAQGRGFEVIELAPPRVVPTP